VPKNHKGGNSLNPSIARMRAFILLIITLLLFTVLSFSLFQQPKNVTVVNADTYNLEEGNAAAEIVIPTVIPKIYESVSPTAGDATLVLRITTLLTNAWFDAIAPYHPTAIGVYSNIQRQPAEETTTKNKNIALLYSSYHILNSLFPQYSNDWRNMLTSVGLDPNDTTLDTSSPVGIGNVAGKAIVQVREHDGMNQLGDEGGKTYNLQPYSDYTGYQPVNTPYELKDPSRWQPATVTTNNGIFKTQQFVTPQMGKTLPYSYKNPNQFHVPAPKNSNPKGKGLTAYKQQADEVLAASANLTDEQKMKAELFDDKLRSLGFSGLFAAQSNKLTLDEFVQYDFLVNVAAFDTAIAVWNEKYEYDSVRPFSAIKYLYGDSKVTAWGGPGKGTVTDIPASEWRSYLNTADHPEYPSGSACFCAAHAEASRLFLGTDELNWTVEVEAGSSRVEPGVTPAKQLALQWETWTDFEKDCGLSRLWGGVHFNASIVEGQKFAKPIAKGAYEFVTAHINGKVKPN
jgi:hypothetical protein